MCVDREIANSSSKNQASVKMPSKIMGYILKIDTELKKATT